MRVRQPLQENGKGGNIKKPSISLVLSWVTSVWEDIPEDMVKKSFLKTGISNDLDGTEDDKLWDDKGNSDGDIFKLKIVYHQHGMLMKMYLKKTGPNCLVIVIIAIMMGFKCLLIDFPQ